MNTFVKVVTQAASALVLVASMSAQAVTVAGLSWNLNPGNPNTSLGSDNGFWWFSKDQNGAGNGTSASVTDVFAPLTDPHNVGNNTFAPDNWLNGYGRIGSINGTTIPVGSQLTYVFEGFKMIGGNITNTLNAFTGDHTDFLASIASTASIKFYLNNAATYNAAGNGTQAQRNAADDGTLWLSLLAKPQIPLNGGGVGFVQYSTTDSSNAGNPINYTRSLSMINARFETTGAGTADSFFDTNLLQFSTDVFANGTGNPSGLIDTTLSTPNFGANVPNQTPEPGTLALIGLALLGVGAARRRRS